MLQQVSVILLIGSFVFGVSNTNVENQPFEDDDSLYEVMKELGSPALSHELNSTIPGFSIEKGREIFHSGVTVSPNGKKTRKQSKHFVCTSCHLTVKEDPDLGNTNPEDRLTYAEKNGLPFLQGTTLYGVVNRKTFYNGDYHKKYGRETVDKVKENLRESIQLCAVGCAQGRALNTWEIESVLAYFWTLELKMGDLSLSDLEKNIVNNGLNPTQSNDNKDALEMLSSKYSSAAPATFSDIPTNVKEGYDYEGNPQRGKLIYDISCLHCHEDGRYSYYHLDNERLTLKHMNRHIRKKRSSHNAYRLVREGTLPVMGDKAYMPQYPTERLSNKQMEDLRSYFELGSKRRS